MTYDQKHEPVLLAVDRADADWYRSIYSEVIGLRTFYVAKYGHLEGARMTGAYATPRARGHEDYWKAYAIMRNNHVLCSAGKAPRVL